MTTLLASHVLFGAVFATLGGAFLVGCRRDAPSSSEEPRVSPLPDAGPPSSASAAKDSEDDTGPSSRTFDTRSGGARLDAGALDPACEGALPLVLAAVDPRCAISEREWKALTRSSESAPTRAANGPLRQLAQRDGDGIVVTLVNGGSAPALVPLRFHPAHPELAFSVLAETESHAVFELAPPIHEAVVDLVRAVDSGTSGSSARAGLVGLDGSSPSTHVYTAVIRLPPGGAARTRLYIDPRVVKRLDRSCSDAGPKGVSGDAGDRADRECLPPRLPRGRVVLYVGQLVAAVDAGPPVRVEWDAP